MKLKKRKEFHSNEQDPEECVPGNGTSLHVGTDSLITALITVDDTWQVRTGLRKSVWIIVKKQLMN